jgi:K+-sensing histidine kinase KdpD
MQVKDQWVGLADRTAAGPDATSDRAAGGRLNWLTASRIAVVAGLAAPLVLTASLVPFRTSFPNTDAALALVLVVVAVAAAGYRAGGYLAALSAAAWFDFFLTRPYERFSITRAADVGTTVLLLLIGFAVTEIAVWGHRQRATASRRSGYLAGINAAARAAAVSDSPGSLADQVAARLVPLLGLRSCEFQYGRAGLGQPGRIERDGTVTVGGTAWDVARFGLPAAAGTELLVESGGRLHGRFLMQPAPDGRPTREQLLVAVAFAEQVAAAVPAGA